MPGIVISGVTGISEATKIIAALSVPTAKLPCHSWIPALPPSLWIASVNFFSPGIYLSSLSDKYFLGALGVCTLVTSTIFSAQPPFTRSTW